MRKGARVLENLIILALAIIFIGGIVLFGTLIFTPPGVSYILYIVGGIFGLVILVIAFFLFDLQKVFLGEKCF